MAEYVDTFFSTIAIYSGYKVAKYAYVLGAYGFSSPLFNPWLAGMWWVAFFVQSRYLMTTYLT